MNNPKTILCFPSVPLLTQYLIWLEGTQMHKVKCNDQYMKTVGLLEETIFIQVKFTNIDGQNKRNRKNVPSSVWTYQSNSCSYTLGSISTVQQQYISLQDNVQMQTCSSQLAMPYLVWMYMLQPASGLWLLPTPQPRGGNHHSVGQSAKKRNKKLLRKDMTAAMQMCGWVNDAMRDGLYIVKVRDGWDNVSVDKWYCEPMTPTLISLLKVLPTYKLVRSLYSLHCSFAHCYDSAFLGEVHLVTGWLPPHELHTCWKRHELPNLQSPSYLLYLRQIWIVVTNFITSHALCKECKNDPNLETIIIIWSTKHYSP